MIKKVHIGITVIAVALVASGCVGTGTFTKMESEKNAEIAALQQQRADLDQQKAELVQRKAALEQDNTDLWQKVMSYEQQNSAMHEHVGTLEQQKAALIESSRQRQQQYDALVQGLSKELELGQLQVRQYKNMLTVDLAEQIFFDSGRSTLKSGGKRVLKKVGGALKGYENKIIRVVGHTDNIPVAKVLQSTFPSNWELSVARATNVVRYLQEVGVPPERMVASGRSEYDPVAANDTPEGRQKNRRIEIMLIDQSLSDEIKKSTK